MEITGISLSYKSLFAQILNDVWPLGCSSHISILRVGSMNYILNNRSSFFASKGNFDSINRTPVYEGSLCNMLIATL